MSAADERKIDEALELAKNLAGRCSVSSPKSTVSGSSKESLDSPGPGSSGPSGGGGGGFFFGALRRRHAPSGDKKSFVDTLPPAQLTLGPLDPNAVDKMFTPDAQVQNTIYGKTGSVDPSWKWDQWLLVN